MRLLGRGPVGFRAAHVIRYGNSIHLYLWSMFENQHAYMLNHDQLRKFHDVLLIVRTCSIMEDCSLSLGW